MRSKHSSNGCSPDLSLSYFRGICLIGCSFFNHDSIMQSSRQQNEPKGDQNRGNYHISNNLFYFVRIRYKKLSCMKWLHRCYPRRNVNMSLNEMIPSTNLVLCSITTTRRTPDDKAYSASNSNQQAQFLMKQKQLISCNKWNPNILLMRSGTWIIQTSTWNTQFLQDFKQGTRLQTSMTLSSALHLVLHIQCLKKIKDKYYPLIEYRLCHTMHDDLQKQ